ncbi:molybdate ABC transporter substrate-binding protein [Paludibacterium yongneupense]|uniref:molybdate ABC transporter substrate-binding protein n=1 Tax=Paludibacterium yongneupense TaxID=400061 RepID=UPI00041C23E8|nr:molybdate ABC transporter substrate-binding protein [Paludibacterium yongneupense]
MPSKALILALLLPAASMAQADVTLYAAGSLQGALREIDAAFTAGTGIAVHAEFGPAGLMRERIEHGGNADVFASADMKQPHKLVADGRAEFAVRFTGNRLCAMAKPALGLTSGNLLAKMLDPTLKLGTSTPGADPAGDYTWAVFAKAEALQGRAEARLKAKALSLVGGPAAAPVPAGKNAIPYLLDSGQADLFIAYCTTGRQARREGVDLTVVDMPPALAQRADYGLTVLRKSSPDAARLALFMLSEPAQAILERWGFEPQTGRP